MRICDYFGFTGSAIFLSFLVPWLISIFRDKPKLPYLTGVLLGCSLIIVAAIIQPR